MIVLEVVFFSEQSDGSHEFEEGEETWNNDSARVVRNGATPSAGKFPMHNDTDIHFETPKVPVIFVLGNYCKILLLRVKQTLKC